MSYLPKKEIGFTGEQFEALLDIHPDEIRKVPVAERLAIVLQHKDLEVQKREAFWNSLQAFATAAIPLLTFLGISSLVRRK